MPAAIGLNVPAPLPPSPKVQLHMSLRTGARTYCTSEARAPCLSGLLIFLVRQKQQDVNSAAKVHQAIDNPQALPDPFNKETPAGQLANMLPEDGAGMIKILPAAMPGLSPFETSPSLRLRPHP